MLISDDPLEEYLQQRIVPAFDDARDGICLPYLWAATAPATWYSVKQVVLCDRFQLLPRLSNHPSLMCAGEMARISDVEDNAIGTFIHELLHTRPDGKDCQAFDYRAADRG